MVSEDEYIHPQSTVIEGFIKELHLNNLSLNNLVEILFRWFDDNISYSRLNAPYYPLQRSDIDVLKMQAGTCGDYTNLVVSVLTRLGYVMKYAYVHVDCYGNPQDHICAAVWNEEHWQLIDATLPYRKWMGPDCQHKEYELLSYDEIRARLKKEEAYWTNKAIEWGNESFAGLLYAPWIHEEIVVCTEINLETVFFLPILDSVNEYNIYVYYCVYSPNNALSVILIRINKNETYYSFSINSAADMWDEKQWGEEYIREAIPEKYCSDRLTKMNESIDRIVPVIQRMIDI